MTDEPQKPPNSGALAGIRILDFSRVLAGPYCSMVLSDYGAEVIKIERPGFGDDTRQWGPPWVAPPATAREGTDQAQQGKAAHSCESAYFLSANRNKQSVTLDLKQPAGQELARRLAAKSDVILENYMPGTATKLGIGYQRLAAQNPGLVYCSISGYGQDGPYQDRPGYDFMIQAEAGLMSITGPADGEPHKVGVAMVDISTGLFAATAILAALHCRQTTGKGQRIDVSLFDSQLACLANVGQSYLCTKETPKRYGNQHPSIVPYQTFATADRAIALAVGNDVQFQRLCDAIVRPDLARDARFHTNGDRVTHRAVLIALLEEVFVAKPAAHWIETLSAAEVPIAPVNDIPAALAHPQAQARGSVQTMTHPTLGEIETIGPVARFSTNPAAVRNAPPLLGGNNREVLGTLLGLTDDELNDLERNNITSLPASPQTPTPLEKEGNNG